MVFWRILYEWRVNGFLQSVSSMETCTRARNRRGERVPVPFLAQPVPAVAQKGERGVISHTARPHWHGIAAPLNEQAREPGPFAPAPPLGAAGHRLAPSQFPRHAVRVSSLCRACPVPVPFPASPPSSVRPCFSSLVLPCRRLASFHSFPSHDALTFVYTRFVRVQVQLRAPSLSITFF